MLACKCDAGPHRRQRQADAMRQRVGGGLLLERRGDDKYVVNANCGRISRKESGFNIKISKMVAA